MAFTGKEGRAGKSKVGDTCQLLTAIPVTRK